MRNAFENNQPEVSSEEALELGDKIHAILPPLAEGFHYRLTTLRNGRNAVVVESDNSDSHEKSSDIVGASEQEERELRHRS